MLGLLGGAPCAGQAQAAPGGFTLGSSEPVVTPVGRSSPGDAEGSKPRTQAPVKGAALW